MPPPSRARACALAVVLACGCAKRAAPSFTVGLLGVGDAATLARLQSSGPGLTVLASAPPDGMVILESAAGSGPSSVGGRLDAARRYWPAGKPLWAEVRPFRERFLNRSELRFMSYVAVIHGAQGLFFEAVDLPGGKTSLDLPELWEAVSGVVGEVQALGSVFAQGTPLESPAPAGGLEAKAWRYRAHDYVVLVNRDERESADLPRELLTPDWRALFELRRDPIDALDNSGACPRLKPHQVLVLESRYRWTRFLL